MKNQWLKKDEMALRAEIKAELEKEYLLKMEQLINVHEKELEEGFAEAYEMLNQMKDKHDKLEVTLYEEYDKKMHEIKNYIIDKVDQFLDKQGIKGVSISAQEIVRQAIEEDGPVIYNQKELEARIIRLDCENKRLRDQLANINLQVVESNEDPHKAGRILCNKQWLSPFNVKKCGAEFDIPQKGETVIVYGPVYLAGGKE